MKFFALLLVLSLSACTAVRAPGAQKDTPIYQHAPMEKINRADR